MPTTNKKLPESTSLTDLAQTASKLHAQKKGLCAVEVSDGRRKIRLGLAVPQELADTLPELVSLALSFAGKTSGAGTERRSPLRIVPDDSPDDQK